MICQLGKTRIKQYLSLFNRSWHESQLSQKNRILSNNSLCRRVHHVYGLMIP
jgi:hypothetical protein